MKKHVIFTSSGEKYGDFVINHWLKSLQENVNLENIDVVVLDYGLNKNQVKQFREKKIIMHKCEKDYLINNIRLRDTAEYLKKHKYDQVLHIDGGDIIFQTDISSLFEKNKKVIRAVCEDFALNFADFRFKDSFYPKYEKQIKETIENNKMINVGVILGPSDLIQKSFSECYKLIKDKNKFGPEQMGLNFIYYRDGFKKIDIGYNFVITTAENKFRIISGKFYYKNHKLIPIVHNLGRVSFWRPVQNFGYGKKYNRLKYFAYYGERFLFKNLRKIAQKSN